MYRWITLTGQERTGTLIEAFDYAFMAHDAMGETIAIYGILGDSVDYRFASNGNPVLI